MMHLEPPTPTNESAGKGSRHKEWSLRGKGFCSTGFDISRRSLESAVFDPRQNEKPAHTGGWSGNVLFSHGFAPTVSSGLKSLTAVFGMGTGVSPSLQSPLHLHVQAEQGMDKTIYPLVEMRGFEPLTSAVQRQRSSN